uniref:Uncharacterized protein n=1 Tax=Anguilla anguilla TaxID=7936 RepID=A0A0E9RNJ9_ANGAN
MLPSYPYGAFDSLSVPVQYRASPNQHLICTVPHTGLSLTRAVAMKLKSTTRLCVPSAVAD